MYKSLISQSLGFRLKTCPTYILLSSTSPCSSGWNDRWTWGSIFGWFRRWGLDWDMSCVHFFCIFGAYSQRSTYETSTYPSTCFMDGPLQKSNMAGCQIHHENGWLFLWWFNGLCWWFLGIWWSMVNHEISKKNMDNAGIFCSERCSSRISACYPVSSTAFATIWCGLFNSAMLMWKFLVPDGLFSCGLIVDAVTWMQHFNHWVLCYFKTLTRTT